MRGSSASSSRVAAVEMTRSVMRALWHSAGSGKWGVGSGKYPTDCHRAYSLLPTPYSPPSNLHLRAELDQPVARNAEECGGGARVAREEGEQLVAPQRHAGPIGGDHGFAADEERRVHQVEIQSLDRAALQRRGDVRVLGEAEAQGEAIE